MDLHFLATPKDWAEWNGRWQALTSGGELWRHLVEFVYQRLSHAQWEKVKSDLGGWKRFIELDAENSNILNRP